MKRIIKFRACDDVLLRYLQPMTIEEIGKGNFGNTNWYQLSLEQWTGLYDKNGVEIYGGDKLIIEMEDDEEIFVVKWDNDSARFIMESETYILDFDNYDGTDCEVIGNIHEIKENNYD